MRVCTFLTHDDDDDDDDDDNQSLGQHDSPRTSKKVDPNSQSSTRCWTKMNSTPMAELDLQAKKRGLSVKYVQKEVREATSMAPQCMLWPQMLMGYG